MSSPDALTAKIQGFGARVTPYYASLIDRNDPHCPIRLQAEPSDRERDPERLPAWAEEWSLKAFGRKRPWIGDAIGDLARLEEPRLTHRYADRALLHVSSHCAVLCRFCFRKEHLGAKEPALYAGTFDRAVSYLQAETGIRELVLTGGDPLSLSDENLKALLGRLSREVPHLRSVRVHTRMPVTLPSRITPSLAAGLAGGADEQRPFLVSLVAHFNHPRELSAEALDGLSRLRRAGVPLYNQSVLLAGVNDRTPSLVELFTRLYECGVRPYYLHHPDLTPRTFGFRRSLEDGRRMIREAAGLLPGPALPRYVLDLPGGLGKVDCLDEGRVRLLERREGDGLQGALYAVTPPATRERAEEVIYFDLSPKA